MAALNFFLLFVFCLHSSLVFSSDASTTDSLKVDTCEPWLPNTTIAVKILKEFDGKWKTSYYAHKRMTNPSRVLDLNLNHEVISCGDTKYMVLTGKLKDTDVDRMLKDSGRDAASDIDARKKCDAGSIDSLTIADISVRGKNTESKLISMEETMNKLMLTMENATRYWSIESQTIADMSDRIGNTESKLISIEETINKLILTKDNATGNGSIDSETNAEISDRVKNTEIKLVSMEETMNKLMLTMENATQNSKVEEKSNYAFDAIFKGRKIELSNDQRTASRLTPLENRFYGGVLSNTPLRDDVAFEMRIDETVNGWSEYGIALGVIVKKDEAVKVMPNICRDVPGTSCIRSWSDGVKGKSHIYKDGSIIRWNGYKLDTRDLPVGTTVGVVRRSNNALHFLLNGRDCGSALENVPDEVYAFVDVIYYVSKVSVIS